MPDYLDSIHTLSRSLAILGVQVSQESRAGLTSRARAAENILLPLLAAIWGVPSLKSANEGLRTAAGIDLWDDSTGLGVQVTAETGASKISSTIEICVRKRLPLKRLRFVLLSQNRPSHKPRTVALWREVIAEGFAFDPQVDIVSLGDLVKFAQNLPAEAIPSLAEELARLVEGRDDLDLLPLIADHCDRQIRREQRLGRYIPDVFVEATEPKYLARCQTHPVLFLSRIREDLERLPQAAFGRLCKEAGVEIVDGIDAPSPDTSMPLSEVTGYSGAVRAKIDELIGKVKPYETATEPDTRLVVKPNLAYSFKELRYSLASSARGLRWRLSQRASELQATKARIQLFVGRAGQGKTNFVCDLVDRFLRRHEILCIYFTARELGNTGELRVSNAAASCLGLPTDSLEKALASLSDICEETGRPLVIIIDGLNEHRDLVRFSGALEHFFREMLRIPHVRILATCRTEFFEERFGNLASAFSDDELQVIKNLGDHRSTYNSGELIEAYFEYFEVSASLVRNSVISVLQEDVLLLRLFCEAYGARSQAKGYIQPLIESVYREEIFGTYLQRKLTGAEGVYEAITGRPKFVDRGRQLSEVLSLIADRMLDRRQFSDLPESVVPTDMSEALTALLDEELVVRRDLGAAPDGAFHRQQTLNFTFDEMRDFVLARRFVGRVLSASDCATALRIETDMLTPCGAQSLEGLQRFLFLLSRKPENVEFFAQFEKHGWYEKCFPQEVFNLNPELVAESDRDRVKLLLASGGEVGEEMAMRLSVRWESRRYPSLNLPFLVEFASSASGDFLENVLAKRFGRRTYLDSPSLAEEFGRFTADRTLAEDRRELAEDERHLLRFLVLLLPVGQKWNLDSPASGALRDIYQKFPREVAVALLESLSRSTIWAQANIWRLLVELPLTADQDRLAMQLATRARKQFEDDGDISREVSRFLASRRRRKE